MIKMVIMQYYYGNLGPLTLFINYMSNFVIDLCIY
jgi:hypothetical protein